LPSICPALPSLQALNDYSYILATHSDLALSEYARTGRALVLYELGQPSDALLALQDQATQLVGSAEVHAALAAVLWVERPNQAWRAEQVGGQAGCTFSTAAAFFFAVLPLRPLFIAGVVLNCLPAVLLCAGPGHCSAAVGGGCGV
jgi:hypothetical protein